MIQASSVLVIGGSLRPRRISPAIVDWVAQTGKALNNGSIFEAIDLRDWPLPLDDEPEIPASGEYIQPHTRAWSEKIKPADGVIFVTPQYNWGYPAALKNALDHLYGEWADKPAMIVTYGGHGGGKCGEQLGQVLGGLHMRLVSTRPMLTLSAARIRANTGEITPAEDFASHLQDLQKGIGELLAAILRSKDACN